MNLAMAMGQIRDTIWPHTTKPWRVIAIEIRVTCINDDDQASLKTLSAVKTDPPHDQRGIHI